MKHLKKFNESHTVKQESSPKIIYLNDLTDGEIEVIETCNDILLDIKDDGFEISVHNENYFDDVTKNYHHDIFILIEKGNFFVSDINDTKRRLESYLNNIGYYPRGKDIEDNEKLHHNSYNDCYALLLCFSKISKAR